MEVTYAFLARGGEFAPDGTFSVFGGDFSTIRGMTFPLQLSSFVLIAKLAFQREECGHHDLRIEVVGEDNANLAPEIKRDLDIPVPQDPEKKMDLHLCAAITGIQFPRPGKYTVRVLLDNQEVCSAKFELVEVTIKEQSPLQVIGRVV